MSFIVDLSRVPHWVPSDVLKKGFEATVDWNYRHLFIKSLVEAQRAAYRGDIKEMEFYLKEMRTCNDRFKEGRYDDIDKTEERIRADFGNEEKLNEFEMLLKAAENSTEYALF